MHAILYGIEMILLIAEMMSILLTHEVDNTLGVVRYCNKKVAG
jgi:hypothetical protein